MSSENAVGLIWLQFSIGLLLATIGISCSGAEEATAQSGEALYQQRCASCRVMRAAWRGRPTGMRCGS